MDEFNAIMGAMHRRLADNPARDTQMAPDAEVLYQFIANAGFTVIDGKLHCSHTLQVMLNRKEAIELMESLLEQLKMLHGREEILVELKGKMFAVEASTEG
jgi:hypothetical protein